MFNVRTWQWYISYIHPRLVKNWSLAAFLDFTVRCDMHSSVCDVEVAHSNPNTSNKVLILRAFFRYWRVEGFHAHTCMKRHRSDPSVCLLMRFLGWQHRDYPKSPFPGVVPPLKPSFFPSIFVCVTVVTVQQLWEMQIYRPSELFCWVFMPNQTLWWCLLRTINTGSPTVTPCWTQRLTRANNSQQRMGMRTVQKQMCGNIPSPFCYDHILLLILFVSPFVCCFVLWFSHLVCCCCFFKPCNLFL